MEPLDLSQNNIWNTKIEYFVLYLLEEHLKFSQKNNQLISKRLEISFVATLEN